MMYEPYRDDLINGMCFIGSNLLEPTPDKPISLSTFFNTDGITVTKIQGEKGDEIMNKVLKIYLDKHSEEIVDKYDNLVEKEYNELEIVKEYKELINEFEINLQLLFDREENKINNVFERVVTQNIYRYDLDEHRLKNEIAMKYRDAKEEEYNELTKLVEEVEAQLSLSDDLEYQLEILTRYEIIDKKTKRIN